MYPYLVAHTHVLGGVGDGEVLLGRTKEATVGVDVARVHRSEGHAARARKGLWVHRMGEERDVGGVFLDETPARGEKLFGKLLHRPHHSEGQRSRYC